jgi:hypothetical protein
VSRLQTGRPGFGTRQRQRIFPLASVQISSETHPASYPLSTGGLLTGAKAWPGRDTDNSPHLLPSSSTSRIYIFPIPLYACMAVAGQLYLSKNNKFHLTSGEQYFNNVRRQPAVRQHICYEAHGCHHLQQIINAN